MLTSEELIAKFQVHLTTFKHGLVVQKLLLVVGAPSNEELAAKRSLTLLEETELRTLFLNMFPTIKLAEGEIATVSSVIDIKQGLLPYYRIIKRAIPELSEKIPAETLFLLEDYLVKESPLHFIAVSVFVVTTMVLIEAGEI